jgi:soluble lytic murein transglycosylase-like protein
MIPLEFAQSGGLKYRGNGNILTRFCFIIALGGFVTGISPAADSSRGTRKITSVVKPDPRTGRLVRSVVVTPRSVGERVVAPAVIAARLVTPEPPAVAPEPPTGIDDAVAQIAAEHKLPPDLLHSVIKVESNYNPYAVSSKGALGLMQLIPSTARRFGVSDVFNPVQNIQGGAKYLRYLLDLYNWDFQLALAAYNAGEAAVAKFGGIPPYLETRNYVVLVGRQLEKRQAEARKSRPAPVKPAVAETPRDPAAPSHIQEIVETDGTIRYVSR